MNKITTDAHLHTAHSGDSQAPMEEMILAGIASGLTSMCFTEHMDYDFPPTDVSFDLNTMNYFEEYLRLRQKYTGQIELLFGVELGLQPHLTTTLTNYVQSYPFDFIIGSSHLVYGIDPYNPAFFEGRNENDCYQNYFLSILENLKYFTNFDVYGHLDYVVRYGPNKNRYYNYDKFSILIDKILTVLIEKGIGIELNTAGFKYGLGQPNPTADIIRKYRQLGGEIITIGSDGHRPEEIAYDFHKVSDILKNCGFDYYTIFRNRKPQFIKL